MAAARALDVLLGAGRRPPGVGRGAAGAGAGTGAAGPGVGWAAAGAGVVGLHTVVVTRLSAHEGGGPGRARGRRRWRAPRPSSPPRGRWWGGGPRTPSRAGPPWDSSRRTRRAVGVPQARARAQGDAATVRRAVGAGVVGLVLLEAALLAAAGRPASAAAVAACWPAARTLSRRRSVT